jgi:hypothetical protein
MPDTREQAEQFAPVLKAQAAAKKAGYFTDRIERK